MGLPLQVPWQGGVVPPHAGRGETGMPAIVMQVPCIPVSPHDWHCPSQSALQQYPSAQKVDAHWASLVHAVPFVRSGPHPPLWQRGVPAGQVWTGCPSGIVVHVPSAVAPSAREQTWHPPVHALSQQTPSAQWPVVHSRQPVVPLQSVELHAPPAATCGLHVLSEAQ
jgi:hypothetical protein